MKKSTKLLSLLLTLSMIFSLLPSVAFATEGEVQSIPMTALTPATPAEEPAGEPADPAAMPATMNAPALFANTPVTTWDGFKTALAAATDSDTITVTGGITATDTATFNKPGVSITITGGTITRGASFVGNVLNITDGTVSLQSITLDGNHVDAGTSINRLVNVGGTGTLNIGAGTEVTKNENYLGGTVHVATGAVLNMTDGKIYNNTTDNAGGGVYVEGGTFNMSGGEISGNTAAQHGGGVSVASGTMTMTNGTITGNHTTGAATTIFGGGVYVHSTGKLEVSGTPKIFGNTNQASAASNTYVMTTTGLQVTGALTAGANIRLAVSGNMSTADTYQIGTCTNNAGLAYITADGYAWFAHEKSSGLLGWKQMSELYVKGDGNATTGTGTFENPYATIAQAYAAVPSTGGEIRVLSDLTVAPTEFAVAKNVTLNSWKADNSGIADTNWVLTRSGADAIMFDTKAGTLTVGNVTIQGSSTVYTTAAMNVQNSGAKLEMTAGALLTGHNIKGTDTTNPAGVLSAGSAANLTITGGEIKGNTLTGCGTAITIGKASNPSFTMTGGKIYDNTLETGMGAVYMRGTASEATLTFGNTAYVYDNKYADGSQHNVYLAAGGTVAIAPAMASGASIGVYVATVPTAGHPTDIATGAATGDAAYFHSDNAGTAYVEYDGSGKLQLVVTMENVYVAATAGTGFAAGDDTASGEFATPVATLAQAYKMVKSGGEIRVLTDLTVAPTVLNGAKNMTLASYANATDKTAANANWVLTRDATLDKGMLTVNKGTLTVGNITLKGGAGKVYEASALSAGAAGAVAVMADGALITGFTIAGGADETNPVALVGSGSGGHFKMTGGEITGNTMQSWANVCGIGLYLNPEFTMTGGKIYNNTLDTGKGAVYMRGTAAQAKFTFGGTAQVYDNKYADGTQHNVYLATGGTVDIAPDLASPAQIGIRAADSANGKAVKIATNGIPEDAQYFRDDVIAGNTARIGKGTAAEPKTTDLYLDGAVAKNTRTGVLYSTFDAAVAAATSGDTIELLTNATTDGAWGDKNLTVQSESGKKFSLTAPGGITANDDHQITLDSLNLVGNITVTGANLTMKTGAVSVSGNINMTATDSKINLSSGSTATERYNVVYDSGVAISGGGVIFDGTTTASSSLAADLAKMTTVSGGSDTTKEWIAIPSTNDVVLKEAKAYYVSNTGDDSSGDGTYAHPYKTIAKAYTAGAAEVGLDIRVLSNLPETVATSFGTAAVTSVKISSYSGDGVKKTDGAWTITRDDSFTGNLLTIATGNVILENITLDGNKEHASFTPSNSDARALVNISAGHLMLNTGATLQNNDGGISYGGSSAGAIVVSGTGLVTMNDGAKIKGNHSASYAGAVLVGKNSGTPKFVMNGGEITGNSATNQTGNAICIWGGAFEMNGGKITGNTGGATGAVAIDTSGTITLTGNVQITGNTKNGAASNVYLADGKTITIGAGHLTAGANVGVYCQTMPSAPGQKKDVATNAIEADKAYFSSDRNTEAGIIFDAGTDKVQLSYDARYIPSTGGDGGGGGGVKPPITLPGPDDGHGKVTISPTKPGPNDKVIITVTPDPGWEIDTLVVVDKPNGKNVPYEPTPIAPGGGKVTIVCPKGGFEVKVTYKRKAIDPDTSGVSRLLETVDHIAYMQGNDSGDFVPTGSITRAETAQMFYNLLKNKNVTIATFDDVPSDAWYATAIGALAGLEIMEGVGDNDFQPQRNITRAEFSVVALRFANSIDGITAFSDVPEDYWAHDAIGGVTAYGWVNGYEDGTFKPTGNITRTEAAVIVNAMLGRKPDKAVIDAGKTLLTFPDVAKSDWSFYQIVEATNAHDYTKGETGVETWTK